MDYQFLMDKAIEASKNSYSPYSHFAVGACVLGESGNYYYGCNFENSSFGLTICAERNAIGNAIANGEKQIKAMQFFHQTWKTVFLAAHAGRLFQNFADKKELTL